METPSEGLAAPIMEIFEADGKQIIIAQVPWEYVRYITYPSAVVYPAPQ